MDGGITIAPLHHVPEFLHPCVNLLNEQWPRSQTARLRSIEGSNDNFPVSLIMFQRQSKELLGHAKLARMPKDPNRCWIESVVISRNLRGKGLGRLLMEGCEKYALEKGFKTLYLSTHDQEVFYSRLGFTLCEPVCYYGAGTLVITPKVTNGHVRHDPSPVKKLPIYVCDNSGLPPPPPPLPEPTPKLLGETGLVKVFMKKEIN